MSNSLRPHELQHAELLFPSTPRACSNSCPLSQWCHSTISSSVKPFSSCLQSFPASGYFQMSQFFTSSGQRIGVSASASVLPTKSQDWFPLGLTGLASPTPGVHSNSRPSIQWCHPTISSSVIPFSSHLHLSHHQGLFQWVSSSYEVAKVLEFQLQHPSFQWIFRTDFL